MTIHPHAWRNLMKSRAVHRQVGGFRILGHLNINCGAPVRIWGLAWIESITYWTACGQEPNVLLKWSVGSWNRFLKLTVSLWRDAAPSVQTPVRRSRCWLFDHVAGGTETLRGVRQDGFAAAPARRKFILAPRRGGLNETWHLTEGLIGWSRGTLWTDRMRRMWWTQRCHFEVYPRVRTAAGI